MCKHPINFMSVMKTAKFLTFFISFCLLMPFSSVRAMTILKTRSKQALIHLDGVQTKKGAYFEVLNLYGKKKGVVQIKRVSETKAIATLKYGSMAKSWSLEPTSEIRVVAVLKKEKQRRNWLAQIHKDKIKRKLAIKRQLRNERMKKRLALKKKLKQERLQRRLALEKKRARNLARRKALERRKKLARRKALERKRKLAKKKQAVQRKLAAYEPEEHILEDLSAEDEQSSEVLSYDSPKISEPTSSLQESSYQKKYDLSHQESSPPANKSSSSSFDLPAHNSSGLNWALGLAPLLEYNHLRITPLSDPAYTMDGLSYGALVVTELSLNRFINVGGGLGYKMFKTSAEENKCGQAQGCSLEIHYLLARLNLKLKLLEFYGHKFWLSGVGTLMQPLLYSNKVPNMTRKSFSPFHGSLGGGLALDLDFGDLVVPVAFNAQVYMPSTATTLLITGGVEIGLTYKF